MRLDLQYKIQSNSSYKMFIREFPLWYKYLNRNPELFAEFEYEVKKRYKLRMSDKISNVADQLIFIREIIEMTL